MVLSAFEILLNHTEVIFPPFIQWGSLNKKGTDYLSMYFICMHWSNFWQPTVHAQQDIFEKVYYLVLEWQISSDKKGKKD